MSDKDESSSKYPAGIRLKLLTISLMLSIFVMALDVTIISTAVPTITTRFHSIDDIGWYTSAYLLPLMAFQPTFGKVYTFFRVKPIFIGAVVLFEIGSIICASAPSSYAFIIGRLVAGMGAGGIFSGAMVIITAAVPLQRVPIYLASLTSMYLVATVTGPPLGGVFTDSPRLTWRFCFWINLPFGFAAVIAILFLYREPKRPDSDLDAREKLANIDVGGTVLFVTSIVMLFIALQIGGTDFAWTNIRVLICFIISGICLAGFGFLQWRLGERATIPPRLLRNRSVSSSVIVAALMSMGVHLHTVYLPWYFQSAKGTTASNSGLRLLPYSASVTSAELVVGAGSSYLGVYLPFMYGGTSIFTVSASLLCTLAVDSPAARVVGFQILAGVGVGSSMQLCSTSIRAAIDEKDIPISSTLAIFGPFFGSALGASIGQNVFRTTLRARLMTFLDEIETHRVIEAGGTGIEKVTSDLTKDPVVEAYNYALGRVFITCAVAGGLAFMGTLFIKWRTLKAKKEGPTEVEMKHQDFGKGNPEAGITSPQKVPEEV
ncbi:MFS general substrate transporter [Massariosphaeria phaeospora]|uniref:MFS general substrate transporter n=1 Tax=Massariosphaeria phaeospora TaxID=100035 RepID=A0A7C8I986_9PLEO|nr:MFS general substrate transporter [Massariosphaeria phaeospora]